MNSLFAASLVITGLGLGAGVLEPAGAEATPNAAVGTLSPADAATDCAALDGYSIPAASIGLPTSGAVVSSTQLVAPDKATRSPEFCLVRGSIAPVDSTARAINFQINLPTQWNLKTLQEGGGGFDGIVVTGLDDIPNTFGTGVRGGPLPALSRGYVTFGSDAGTAPDGSALVNDEVLANYEGAAVKKTRDTGIDIVARYYGQQPQQQYFAGGSKGGHEALVAAQRYPADYTGVIANYPANQIAAMAITWDHMKQLAYQRDGGFLDAAKQQLLRKAIYASCDSLDGAQDGVVSNTGGCAAQFDVRDLLCPNGADTGDSCLSETQVGTLTGAANPYRIDFQLANGITTLGGFPVLTGADIGPRQQDSWWLNSTDTDNSLINFLSSRLIRYAIERNPTANLDGWDYRDWEPRLKQLSREFDATTPDLDRFFARGGKLILVQGDDDVLVPEHSTSAYFETLMGRYGRSLHNYARYYRQPGYGHAQGTFDLSFDSLGALETWTTTGVAPLTPTAADINTGRTMPLCQYPSWPRYQGSGDTTKATSYTCVTGDRPRLHRHLRLALASQPALRRVQKRP
ncbi:tannase/feruloyl esterase family alpha/beta hydrolase [Actinoallomurus soli]|uniref:tannase/feruloyl esterase family alpha/beta hydrolase n=1 Tax=Actinoallomurus soli TaxID=2952535 RepID=UPI002093F655|nr:tannase/feruloyl esterase family alpha/beta hydrolase [Actinoallomurus soli]MCO5975049.1 tannase/feruloyl esterase family alpha/beta hydrolase [Actinoallomurus soli]